MIELEKRWAGLRAKRSECNLGVQYIETDPSMDLDELLSFKPQKKLGKRPLDEQGIAEGRPSKSLKSDNGAVAGNGADLREVTDEEKLLLLQNLDDVDEEPG